jgi:type I restriction enzyme R subunit
MTIITESIIEQATLDWFEELDYSVLNGPDIAPGELFAERTSYSDVILEGRVRSVLSRINPTIPNEAIEDAYRKLIKTTHESPLLYENNYRFHKMLTDGVDVEYKDDTGRIVGDKVWLADFNNPANNDWLAVNQFTVGIEARAGTLTADWEWFLPWRTIEGKDIAPKGLPELEVLIKGIFGKQRFLDFLKYFIVFEVDGSKITKKMAAYHQFHAVNRAVSPRMSWHSMMPLRQTTVQ